METLNHTSNLCGMDRTQKAAAVEKEEEISLLLPLSRLMGRMMSLLNSQERRKDAKVNSIIARKP